MKFSQYITIVNILDKFENEGHRSRSRSHDLLKTAFFGTFGHLSHILWHMCVLYGVNCQGHGSRSNTKGQGHTQGQRSRSQGHSKVTILAPWCECRPFWPCSKHIDRVFISWFVSPMGGLVTVEKRRSSALQFLRYQPFCLKICIFWPLWLQISCFST